MVTHTTGQNSVVADEPVGFEKQLVEVHCFRKITDRFGGICGIYLGLVVKSQKITTCNPIGLGNTRILTDGAQNLSRRLIIKTWFRACEGLITPTTSGHHPLASLAVVV